MNAKLILTAVTAATLLFGLAQDPASRRSKTKPVTVFLLRHAEAGDRSKTNDPALTAAGEQRAKALARLLGNAAVTHLFASEYKRTQLTLVPLARSTSLRVQVISSRKREEQLRALRSLPGGAIAVVAGHSNTLPQLALGLGGRVTNLSKRGFIAHDAYDRLFMVALPTGKSVQTQTIELRYGAARGGN